MNDETLKEQIDEIRKYLKKELSGETYVKASDKDEEVFIEYKPTKKALDRTMGMIERFILQDRERAVRENTPVTIMGKTIEEVWVILSALELEHIEDMKMTMSNLDRWMKRVREDQNKAMLRAIDNSYSQLSNPTQTKKTK